MAYPQDNEDRFFHGPSPCLPGKHHTVEEKRPVAVPKLPSVEGHHSGIKALRRVAHRSRAYLLPQDGKEGLPYLPGGEPQEETGEDEAVHIPRPACIGP